MSRGPTSEPVLFCRKVFRIRTEGVKALGEENELSSDTRMVGFGNAFYNSTVVLKLAQLGTGASYGIQAMMLVGELIVVSDEWPVLFAR